MRITTSARFAYVLALATLLTSLHVSAAGAAQGGSDMRIDSLRTTVRSGPAGTRVVFKVVAENAGPDLLTSSLDVVYTQASDVHTRNFSFDEGLANLHVTAVSCYRDHFGGTGSSPDTPACEFGVTEVGDPVYMKAVARIAAHTPRRVAELGSFVSNEAGETDPDPSNDTAVARILITQS